MNVKSQYHQLLEEHGRQGWWPILNRANENGFDSNGYHPGRYDIITDENRFDVYTGAILTQNTSWTNAQQALQNLKDQSLCSPDSLLKATTDRVAKAIVPARYYNTKAQYLQAIANTYKTTTQPTRNNLLDTKGVGPETADTILLYAHNEPRIIADTYTKRWLADHGISVFEYDAIATYLDERFPRKTSLRKELHALIVAHQKQS